MPTTLPAMLPTQGIFPRVKVAGAWS